jgi:hypothetical protein
MKKKDVLLKTAIGVFAGLSFMVSQVSAYPIACVKTDTGCKITDSGDGDIKGTVDGDYCVTNHGDRVKIQAKMPAPVKSIKPIKMSN